MRWLSNLIRWRSPGHAELSIEAEGAAGDNEMDDRADDMADDRDDSDLGDSDSDSGGDDGGSDD